MRLEVRDLGKSFGASRVLDQVSFSVRAASIVAVLGENGAGKSTLMKILSGALAPDSGTLTLDGQPYRPTDPGHARRSGVAIVHQELSICPDLSVDENVLLGVEPRRFGFIDPRATRERTTRAFAALTRPKQTLDRRRLVRSLSAADRQLVEIARALAQERVRLLILDEPTSSLAGDDVERLFDALSRLKSQGISVLYISHFLEEVRRVADEFVVLRDGRSVKSGALAECSNTTLIEAMAGKRVESSTRTRRERGALALSTEELAGRVLPKRATLELYRAEVLGIAGLVGSGRTELFRCIFGLGPIARGSVRVGAYTGGASPRVRLAQGVGLLSEDRKSEGLALDLSIAHNITLSNLKPVRRRGFISDARERALAERWISRLGIRCSGPEQPVRELSGGNQQKVALARLLFHDVDVFLLDEPTRGIDVQSRSEVHRSIGELADRGKAILMISSQLSELLSVCDRIAILHRGELGPARASEALNEALLLAEAAGA